VSSPLIHAALTCSEGSVLPMCTWFWAFSDWVSTRTVTDLAEVSEFHRHNSSFSCGLAGRTTATRQHQAGTLEGPRGGSIEANR
jgi:hypothetical protein